MAKVKQEQAQEGAAPAAGEAATSTPKEPKAPKVSKFVKGDTALTDGVKLAPQAKLIVKHVVEAGEITREDLIKKLGVDPEFKTRQPIERIISYYQKDLQEKGLVKLAA